MSGRWPQARLLVVGLELELIAHTAGLSPLERLIEPRNLSTHLLDAPRGYG